jgi:rare lipoprotein A
LRDRKRPAAQNACRADEARRAGAILRCLFAAGTALALANCAGSPPVGSGRHASELKYGVKSSPRVIPEGQPVPKGGGREMVGQAYVVAGRTYKPHPGRGYDREGWASWYGTAFHGRLTANGEIFDRDSIAAAHPTLPLPSYVRVTNVVNKRSMVVRVNDRGPYERDRVIDLSERAADALGFRHRGTGRVRVEYLGKASLDGSDDARLLATLRSDGGPAALDPGQRRIQVAQAETRPSSAREERRAASPPTRTALPEFTEPARPSRAPAAARMSAAAAGPESRPLDIRPPRRPDLAGIY